MPSYEQDDPSGRWPVFPRKPSQPERAKYKTKTVESRLHSSEVHIERKYFSFQLRENSRGRILRITEEGSGKRSSIIIPASGMNNFRALVEEMAIAALEIRPKGGENLTK
jgi:hypothetical protein